MVDSSFSVFVETSRLFRLSLCAHLVLRCTSSPLLSPQTQRARELSLDNTKDSPFALLAKENDIMWGGGMPDDITVVALRVINRAESSAAVRDVVDVVVVVFVLPLQSPQDGWGFIEILQRLRLVRGGDGLRGRPTRSCCFCAA